MTHCLLPIIFSVTIAPAETTYCEKYCKNYPDKFPNFLLQQPQVQKTFMYNCTDQCCCIKQSCSYHNAQFAYHFKKCIKIIMSVAGAKLLTCNYMQTFCYTAYLSLTTLVLFWKMLAQFQHVSATCAFYVTYNGMALPNWRDFFLAKR